jgi:hypothetical protein
MKIRLISLACVALCLACSAPKTAYKFNYHDYNAGRKAKDVKQEVASNPGPVPVSSEQLLAMEPVKEEPVASIESVENPVVTAPAKAYEDMSKKERRQLRREFKKEIKSIIRKNDGVSSVEETKAMDRDLKLAAIFGAVGFVGLLLWPVAYPLFSIIGGIALIIGVVFFVKWLIRQ